ncbi:MAG: pyridoxamine 5'-phosphate oxidase family protein [Phycisphaeraceae bacterium]
MEKGVESSKHRYHTPVVATVDPEGMPTARVIVLRAVDAEQRSLVFHSDARAPKIEHLRQRPQIAWSFWSPDDKVQLRVAGRCMLHFDDELADRQWRESTAASKRCYLAPHPPSSEADEASPNLPEDVRGVVPSEDRVEAGRSNFAVVRTHVLRIDWLYLHHEGHRRARFTWTEHGAHHTTWLQP